MPNILIVGGGIGGLALAIALRQAGFSATVWERAPELREVGAGLLLTANAVGVLRRLGLLDTAVAEGRVTRSWQILDRTGGVLQTFRFGEKDWSLSIPRAQLQMLLARELTETGALRLDREVAGVEEGRDSNRTVVRSIGSDRFEADLVIGADGVHSVLRGLVDDAAVPRELGYVGWRALVDRVPREWSEGRVTESWADGCRFGIAPVSADVTYWYATENVAPGWEVPIAQRKSYLIEKFRGWHPPIGELIAATRDEAILLSGIAELPPLRRWHRDRVALLGDAAHLMTPNLGQGAAMALEDAWVLAQCVRAHGIGESALREYERRRRWRTAVIVWLSSQVGRVIQWQHPIACGLRAGAMRLLPDAMSTLALAPIFRHHV